jgi:hypothetical protein
LTLNPPQTDYHLIRCMQLRLMENFKEAIEEATVVINQEPNNSFACYLRGYNRFLLKDFLGAIEDLSRALRLTIFRVKLANYC